MNDLLKKILDNKRKEVSSVNSRNAITDMKARLDNALPTVGFIDSIRGCTAKHKVISEIKRISPGTGFRREDFNAEAIAKGYKSAGAAAISVLTDQQFFGGSLEILQRVRASVDIPILRKDFILSDFQVYEARANGADAILLMAVNFESVSELSDLAHLAIEVGLDVLLEIHDEDELKFIPEVDVAVGINNRDFKRDDLKVDISATKNIAPLVKDAKLLVSESGIRDVKTMVELEAVGIDAFLIGSAFMESEDPGAALAEFLK